MQNSQIQPEFPFNAMCTGTSGPLGPEFPGGGTSAPSARTSGLSLRNFIPFIFPVIFFWPPGHECLSMLSCLFIHLLAGSSPRIRTKRAASHPARPPPSAEIEDESDQETLASRRAQIDEQRKKKKVVQVTICSMTKTEFTEWRRIDFYDQPRDYTIDSCFWCYDQEILLKEVYAVMKSKKKVCPMKAIDFAHLQKKADYFGTAIRVVDCLGLRHPMKLECNYNVFMVQQFYATMVFYGDVNTDMTWMSGSHKLKATFQEFGALLGYPFGTERTLF